MTSSDTLTDELAFTFFTQEPSNQSFQVGLIQDPFLQGALNVSWLAAVRGGPLSVGTMSRQAELLSDKASVTIFEHPSPGASRAFVTIYELHSKTIYDGYFPVSSQAFERFAMLEAEILCQAALRFFKPTADLRATASPYQRLDGTNAVMLKADHSVLYWV